MIQTLTLVDDSEIDQMIHRRIIDRTRIVQRTLPFLYAEQALDHLIHAEEPAPDLILLDVNMPRMNGFEFLEAMEAQLGQARTPEVVMLTTSLDPADETRARSFPAVQDFRSKPLTGDDLAGIADLA